MPKPDDDILLNTLVRVAKEQKDLAAAMGFLQVLSETSFSVDDSTPFVAAYWAIKAHFNNRTTEPLVKMEVQNNNGSINTMERCSITTHPLSSYADVNNNPPQLRTGQSY